MVALRRELDDLRRLVENLREFQPPQTNHSLAAVATADDIASALYQHVADRSSVGSSRDDELAEFYDARSEEPSTDYESPALSHSTSNGHLPSPSGDLETLYRRVDILLANEGEGAIEDRRNAYELIKQYYPENQSNYVYLWRLSKATYLYGRILMDIDEPKRKELCFEAKDHAFAALALNADDADVHKWCALTIGTLTDFVSLNQRLKDGWTFKIHIDKAIELRPKDAILRHLSGRWLYEVACLSWWERKIANAIFSNVPASTYDEALEAFLEADRLKPNWKENELYIALCHHNKGEKKAAKQYLQKARDAISESVDDVSAEKEIEKLWQEYGKLDL